MKKASLCIQLLFCTFFVGYAALASASSFAQLNPDTAGVDLKAPSKPAGTKNEHHPANSLKASCREQWTRTRAYDAEFCKKKCANGEKRFCACAKDPCTKYEQEFKEAEQKPSLASEKPIAANGKMLDLTAWNESLKAILQLPWQSDTKALISVENAEKSCMHPTNIYHANYCRALCEAKYKRYCDFCNTSWKDIHLANGYLVPKDHLQNKKIYGDTSQYGLDRLMLDQRFHKAVACQGDSPKPGVGYPNVPQMYERMMTPQRQWKGMYAELEGITWLALRNAWEANAWGSKNDYNGFPTLAEANYVIVNVDRRSEFYRKWWWEKLEGGTQENPVVIIGKDKYGYATSLNTTLQPGLHAYTNPVWRWPFWIDYRP